MGFDKNDTVPSVNPKKRTTKVNFGVIIGVILFFAVSAAAIFFFKANPEKTVPKQERQTP
ncbi:MAG: hypothetical protein JWM88_1673 [Verrucomicrobia bacterium]|nr:hypothetical protein [Verrucomicrobiota bacterium]